MNYIHFNKKVLDCPESDRCFKTKLLTKLNQTNYYIHLAGTLQIKSKFKLRHLSNWGTSCSTPHEDLPPLDFSEPNLEFKPQHNICNNQAFPKTFNTPS